MKEDEIHVNRTLIEAGEWTTYVQSGSFRAGHRNKKNIF